jgi:hypothetical protein
MMHLHPLQRREYAETTRLGVVLLDTPTKKAWDEMSVENRPRIVHTGSPHRYT